MQRIVVSCPQRNAVGYILQPMEVLEYRQRPRRVEILFALLDVQMCNERFSPWSGPVFPASGVRLAIDIVVRKVS